MLDDAKEEGLLVDISMAAETVQGLTLSEFTDCLEDLTQELENGGSAYKHAFIDIQNEYNKGSNGPSDARPMSDSQIAAIVAAIKAVDGTRLVTASMGQNVHSYDADDRADTADLDILAWHEEQFNGYWDCTGSWVGDLDDGGLPVYLQEPARLPESYITADAYAANVYNAKNAYADAWTMHNAGSFQLGSRTLEQNLQGEEKDFLDCLAEALSSGTCTTPPAPQQMLSARGVHDLLKRWLSPPDTRKPARESGVRR